MRTSLRKDGDRHVLWLVVTTILFIASGALALVPGPNVLAYFLGFFVVARYLSWRGARHGLSSVVWQMTASTPLSELRGALQLSGEAREPLVLDIAMRLRLEDLPLFVARMVPSPWHAERRRRPRRAARRRRRASGIVPPALTLRELADRLGCRLEGDGDRADHPGGRPRIGRSRRCVLLLQSEVREGARDDARLGRDRSRRRPGCRGGLAYP